MSLNYKLEAGYHFSGDVTDFSGNGNDGVNSGVTFTTDKNGNASSAGSFNANYVTLGNILDTTNSDFSISLNLNTSDIDVNGSTDGQIFLDTLTGNSNDRFFLRLYPSGELQFWTRSSGNTVDFITSGANIQQGNFYHIVFTRTGSTGKVFVDGVLITTGIINAGNIGDSNNTWILGAYSDNISRFKFVGTLDEVRIYSRALTEYEIFQLFVGYETEQSKVGTLNYGLYWVSHFSNGTAVEWSGNGTDGTVNGATATTDKNGTADSALSFDGSNDFVDTNDIFQSGNTFSVSFWLNKDSTTSKSFISTRNTSTSGIELGNSLSNFVFSIQGDTYVTSGNNLTTSVWQHIIFVYDGSDRIVYVNGVEIGRSAYTSSITTGGNLEIGRREFSPVYLDGKIDEPRIYNRTLYPYEIAQLNYAYKTENDITDIVDLDALRNATQLYYSMDNADVSGSTILDLTPNNNDGTINGATTGVTGILNEAFSFDGVNDYVDTGYTGSGLGWRSLWIKTTETGDAFIYGGQNSAARNRNDIRLNFPTTNDLTLRAQDGNGNNQQKNRSNAGINDGNWHHIFVVYQTDNILLFIDGVQQTLTYDFDATLAPFNLGSTNTPYIGGFNNAGSAISPIDADIDKFIIGDSLPSGSTYQELATYFYNSGVPTVNQQYPFSSNVETLENVIKEELQPLTFSLALQDIRFTTADILNLSPLQFNTSLQDITFKNIIKEDLDTLTFNQKLQDVEIKNIIQFTLDPLEFNLELLNVSLPEPEQEILELEPLVFNLGLNDIKFQLVTSPLLDSARNDIQQVLEEIGEPITYRRYVKTFDDVGQLKEKPDKIDYSTLALFEDGDDKNKETNQYGEFIAGTQNVNLAYQISNGVYPKVRDILIDLNGVEWEIIQVKPSRLYGAVWDNNVVVQRKTNFQ